MIQSMTGFGKAEAMYAGNTLRVELRSLNNRYFDLNLRMPLSLRNHEAELRSLLNEKLLRGKADALLVVENGNDNKSALNKTLAVKYHEELKELSRAVGEEGKNLLPLVIQMPEVIGIQKGDDDVALWNEVKMLVIQAAADLMAFRTREGEGLRVAFEKHVEVITKLLEQVEVFEAERKESIRNRLLSQLKELDTQQGIDHNRFEQELIFYLERLDFTEEKVRLRSHCDFFLKTLNDKESNGRRLGFISQEMGREINTLGSKANHAAIQKLVVEMKDELEKIKEQLLNVL